MMIKDGMALLKVSSHRAREKLEKLLGRQPQCYYSFHREGYWYAVTPEELEKVKRAKIKCITQSDWKDDLLKCWDWK